MHIKTLRLASVIFLAFGIAAFFAGLLFSFVPTVNPDVARANYSESTSTVEAINGGIGNSRTITTSDSLTISESASVCPTAPRALAVGDQMTVATLPSVDGSTPLSLVGPCDPVKMGHYVENASSESGGYASGEDGSALPMMTGGILSASIGIAFITSVVSRERREERRKLAEIEDFVSKNRD